MSRRPVTAASLVIGVLLAGCSAGDRADPRPTTPVSSAKDGQVATVRVQQRDIYRTVRLEGTVEAIAPAPVVATETGRFVPVTAAKRARTVDRGQRLGVIRCTPADSGGTGGQAPTATPTPTPSASTAPPCQVTVRAGAAGQMPALVERDVTTGETIASVQPPGLRIRLPVTDPAVLYAFKNPPRSGKGEIVGGPSGFTVGFDRRSYDAGNGQTTIFVRMPSSVQAFPGLKAIVVFVTAVQDNLTTLPLSAVRGRSGTGQVVTVDARGKRTVVEVKLGASDDAYVAVTGLDDDTEVLLYPLESDFGG